jgi:hypothetical protein
MLTKEAIADIVDIARFIMENEASHLDIAESQENSRRYSTLIKPRIGTFEKKYGNRPDKILLPFLEKYMKSRLLEGEFQCESRHFYRERKVYPFTDACIFKKDLYESSESAPGASHFPQLFISLGELDSSIMGLEFGFRYGEAVSDLSDRGHLPAAVAHGVVNLIRKKAVRTPGTISDEKELARIWTPEIRLTRVLSANKTGDTIEKKIEELMDKLIPLFKYVSAVEWEEETRKDEQPEGADLVHFSIGELSGEEDLETTVAHDLQSMTIEQSSIEKMKKSGYNNSYERDLKLRYAAIAHHGRSCKVCGFNFEALYGERGRDYIEVHHLRPVFPGRKATVHPETDMTVLCSNCHRMIHRYHNNVLTVEELKSLLRR